MAEIKTMRALQNQMRDASRNLSYDIGTGANGEMLFLGRWTWPTDKALPELPALLRSSTPRQRRDHRYAESLRTAPPDALLKSLLKFREVIAEAVQADIELRSGFLGQELDKARVRLGESLLASFIGAVGHAQLADERLSEVRRSLAAEYFETGDANGYLKSLGLQDEASEVDPARETQVAVQTAIFDAEIARALKPLSPADRTIVMEGRTLPKQLDDPRVLAAIFRVPQTLLPFDAEELRAIAALAFLRNWPKTAAVAGVVETMIEQVRPVAGSALMMVGRLIDPGNAFDVFRRVPGGRWALEPLARTDYKAKAVFDDLCIYALPV